MTTAKTFGEWLDIHDLTLEGGKSGVFGKPEGRRWYIGISELQGVRSGLAGEMTNDAKRSCGQGFTFPDALKSLYCVLAGRVIVIYEDSRHPQRELLVPEGLEGTA
jgi:hypothetical protein